MKVFLFVFWSILAILSFNTARAAMPSPVSDTMPNAQIVGEGRLRYLFWDVSDISLYAPKGEWLEGKPYALTLTYLRNFDGDDIAKRSVKEIRKQGVKDPTLLNNWEVIMTDIFPDVETGQQLTGILNSNGITSFYMGDTFIGEVDDSEFGRYFFAIWLGDKTSHPSVRKQLIGKKR